MSDKGLFCGTNVVLDRTNVSAMEKKHLPVIDCPDTVMAGEPFEVRISIGEIPHVMEETHHVQWIDVYFGQNYHARVDLTPVFTRPEVTLTLVKGGKHRETTLRVVERCNIHGQWETSKTITVSE